MDSYTPILTMTGESIKGAAKHRGGEELARHIDALVTDKSLRLRMGSMAKIKSEEYKTVVIIKEWIKYFERQNDNRKKQKHLKRRQSPFF